MVRPQSLNRSTRAAAIVLVAALAGCSSSQTTSLDDLEPSVRFSANGTLVQFTTRAESYAVLVAGHCSERVSLQVAAWEPWDTASRLGLRVSGGQDLGLGTYTNAQDLSDPPVRIHLYYRDAQGIDYFAGPVIPDDATVVISYIGPSTVEGMFFGVLKAVGHPDVIITDGEFTVRREHDLRPEC